MSERIRIDYAALFTVDIRHEYFLNRGEKAFEHMLADEQRAVLREYDVRDQFDVCAAAETKPLLKRHRLLFRRSATGFSVFAPVTDGELDFPLDRSTPLRFYLISKNRYLDDVSNFGVDHSSTAQTYLLSTGAANVDSEGLHLSKPLRGFSSAKDYPAGSQIVNSASDSTQRLIAVRNIVKGSPRNAADWINTPALPAKITAATAANLNAGDRARKNSAVYEALVSDPGVDVSAAAKWKRVFVAGIQALSDGDRVTVSGQFAAISLSDVRPEFVTVEISDLNGRVVRRTELAGSTRFPLETAPVDFSDLPAGNYRVSLRDGTGSILTNGGVGIPQAVQSIYVDREAIRNRAVAIVEVQPAIGGYNLVGSDNKILSPNFLIRIPSRATFWSYTFPKPLTAAERAQIGAAFEVPDERDELIITQRARRLARGFVKLQRLNTGKLLPNPTEKTGIAVDDGTGRLISPIHLSHKT